MMHEESQNRMRGHECYQAHHESLSLIAYQSTAATVPSQASLDQLLRSAQSRNRAEGLTGVLVYARGEFFQWLEGPTEALHRVWASIRRDPRHRHVTLLRDEPVSNRVFEGWDLRIAQGENVSVDATVAAMESSTGSLKRVIGSPTSLFDMSLVDLFASIVIPRLLQVHGRDDGDGSLCAAASIWHADPNSGAQLATALLAPHAQESSCFIDALLDRGASFNALYREVFEPAQLELGELWDRDVCNDFGLGIGLSRLQSLIRRVNAAIPAEYSYKPAHSVLLSMQPNEPHCTGLVMSSEVFDRKGWDVRCQFPINDQALNDLLETQWFDVLKLSQSGSLRRDSRLTSIRETIDSARGASLNPALIVMVDGRSFVERPQIYRAVHANATCVSVLDAAPMAERLLGNRRSVMPVFQESMA